jgi:hypothetical protein
MNKKNLILGKGINSIAQNYDSYYNAVVGRADWIFKQDFLIYKYNPKKRVKDATANCSKHKPRYQNYMLIPSEMQL